MIKLSKKQLKDISKSMSAFYCGGNVYNHENITHWLSCGDFESIKKLENKNNDIIKLLNFLDNNYNLKKFYNYNNNNNLKGNYSYYISASQIAYSCGYYGNSGQLVKYNIINKVSNEAIFSFYTYYC